MADRRPAGPGGRRRLLATAWPALAASLVTAGALVLVGWLDYGGTRAELLRLLRDQAASLAQTVAAAARSNEAAGAQGEREIGERLLDNARLLAELDRRGGLTPAFLDEIASRNRLFRVTLFAADGSREQSTAWPGFPPPGRGFGSALVDRVLRGTETEAVTELHTPRWGGGARIAAAVRRPRGGALVLNVDASSIAALRWQTSLDQLVHDIVASAGEVAYVVLEGPGLRIAHGDLPTAGAAGPPAAPADLAAAAAGNAVRGAQEAEGGEPAVAAQRVTVVNGRPVLEFSAPIRLSSGSTGRLQLGLRLDGVRQAERRLLVRLALSLTAALSVSLLVLWTVWLRKAYGALSEKHALAEAALRRRDRLSAMGELAATVAHEIRNPLNAIAMSSKRLGREFLDAASPASEADRDDARQLLGVVEHETQRINAIVQQFLEFARPPKLAPRPADVAATVSAVVEANRELAASRGVSLEADLPRSAEAVIDPDQLRQAVENLVRNAIEATPAGGRVTATARRDGRGHAVEIRDTGAGIDAETLPRIFDLYFTTKATGTGVGLAVTQQIVAAHGGTIEVQSKPGSGTVMTIRLPGELAEAARA